MQTWQIRFEEQLGASAAPPVVSRDLLARLARSARSQRAVPASSLTHWLRTAQRRGKLRPVQRGLYLNGFRARPGQAADATPWLRADAVVSLNTVLGEAGVLNNPAHTLTAVVPIDQAAPPPHLGRQRTQAGVFHFFGLPRRILESGAVHARLDSNGGFEHPRATPEKALLDWLYLAASPRSHRTFPPRGDLDMTMLDAKRLRHLAAAAGMANVLKTWLAKGR